MIRRGLLIDRNMPCCQARYRQVIAKSLIDKFCKIDIFVKKNHEKSDDVSQQEIELHYERTKDFMEYERNYDILIFDKKYAFLQKFNDFDFDGLAYIGSCRDASFMFSHKNNRSFHKEAGKVDFTAYDFFYYIFRGNFMTCYEFFRNADNKLHIVHLFPGGYFDDLSNLQQIPDHVHIVSPLQFVSNYLQTFHPKKQFLNVFTGPYSIKGEKFPTKKLKEPTEPLHICFAAQFAPFRKGCNFYDKVVRKFIEKHGNNPVKFHLIGQSYQTDLTDNVLRHHGMLSQKRIDYLYENQMDIMISPYWITRNIIGFPHGIEGMLYGLLLFTTDFNNCNDLNGYHFTNDEIYIIRQEPNSFYEEVNRCVNEIHRLEQNRVELWRRSHQTQKKAIELFGYDNTMKKVENYIEANIK